MNITKKIDRAFQWAGEKMGQEAKTNMSEEFKMLETEMALRFDGMLKLQTSMNAYIKWLTRRGEAFDDKDKGLPTAFLGRTMIAHGEDFENESDFGNCLIAMGRANERVSSIQEQYSADATSYWLDSLERSLAMMKEYQAARKKLESRRLALDASTTKLQKAKRDDFRVEEELRTARAKYEESSEDVYRRMQDIKDAEADSVRDLTCFLDAELDFHERCAEELRRVRRSWTAGATASSPDKDAYGAVSGYASTRRHTGRSRSNTAHSHVSERETSRMPLSRTNSHTRDAVYEEEPDEIPPQQPTRAPIRSQSRVSVNSAASNASDIPPRLGMSRSNTYASGASLGANLTRTNTSGGTSTPLSTVPAPSVGSLRSQLKPVGSRPSAMDVFADNSHNEETVSASDSPFAGWGAGAGGDARSPSPATSHGSLSWTNTNTGSGAGAKKGPPPPPPSRAKKPPPPVPARREAGY